MIKRGFSAIEVIIVVALSTIVMSAIYSIYLTYNSTYLVQNASIAASESAAFFMNDFAEIGRQSSAIVSTRTFSGVSYSTGSTTLILEVPAIDSNSNVLPNTYDYAVFYSTSTSVYRIFEANALSYRASTTKKYSDIVSNLTFTYNNGTPSLATSTAADITSKTQVKLNTIQTRLKHQIYLRNK
jgi:prepilin-type N-terminal cleavage/methylation domain-containing protein